MDITTSFFAPPTYTHIVIASLSTVSSEQSSCLDDEPTGKHADLTRWNHPGLKYNADMQCALREGDGSKQCSIKKDVGFVTVFVIHCLQSVSTLSNRTQISVGL